MLNFDLNQTPPTVEEIAAERQEIERRLAGLKWKARVGLIVLVVAVVATVGLGSFFSVCIAIGISVGVLTQIGARVENRIGELANHRSSLDNIPPSACDQLIADCLTDPLCEAYRQKVAALGRKPVKAETKLIREWVAGADAREKERREGIACALVASKEPLPADADTGLKGEISC